MKKRRILMGKTHLIAGAVMLAVAGGQLSAPVSYTHLRAHET